MKVFDIQFILGFGFVVLALVVAGAAMNGSALPLVGLGRGPLIAVAVLGMSGCAIAGISQATPLGWTHPLIVFGSIVGVIALAVIAAGLFGWDGLVRPIASVTPGGALIAATTEQLAVISLAGIIVVKFVVNLAFALRAP